MDFNLLKELCGIKSPSGEEEIMKNFILGYIRNLPYQDPQPEILSSSLDLQDSLIIAFGKPEIAVFAHMDTIGFSCRYFNQLIPIGSPDINDGCRVYGQDQLGPIECNVYLDDKNRLFHDFSRKIERGTTLVYKRNYYEKQKTIQSAYLDNRIGLWICLKLAEKFPNVLLVFSCWEEHGGGSVSNLARIIWEKYRVHKVLIADVTWVTDGILPGEGTVISIRDQFIPRKSYIQQIIDLAHRHTIAYQLEVEPEGSSDGSEIQRSPYPMDWCFIGPPVENTHSPQEKAWKNDIISTLNLYEVLWSNL